LSFELDVTAYMASELAFSMTIIDDVSQLELGIESLLNGHCTTIELNRQRYHLCLRTPQAVYAHVEFDVTRHENDVFIRLRLPVSFLEDVSVYRKEIFELPVPGTEGLIISLSKFPPYFVFVYSESTALVGELTSAPTHFILRDSDIMWNRHYADDCMQEIIADNADSVHSVCKYTVRKAEITPCVKQLAKNTYVLTNYIYKTESTLYRKRYIRHSHHRRMRFLSYSCTVSVYVISRLNEAIV
jgi:hypothetical protein